MKKASEKAALTLVSFLALAVVTFLAASMVIERRRTAAIEQLNGPTALAAYARLAGRASPDAIESKDGAGPKDAPHGKPGRTGAPKQTMARFQRLFDDWRKRNADYPTLLDIDLWSGPFDELPSEDKLRFAEALEANWDYFQEIRRVARLGGPAYFLDFAKGAEMELPHLAPMRGFARLLCRDAVFQAHGGNLEGAVEDLIAAMQLGEALTGEPLLISQLNRMHIYHTVSEGMRDALPPGALSAEQTARLVAQLADAHNRQAFADGLSGETSIWLTAFEQTRGNTVPYWLEYRTEPYDWKEEALFRVYTSPIARPWFYNDEATFAEFMGQMAEAALLPYFEAVPELNLLNEEIDSLPGTRVMSRVLLSDLTRAHESQARHEATIDLMRMGLLLEQYNADNGVYPDSLGAIASSLGGALPVDPFTGESYVYQPSANSFLLYGVGMNRTDEGGMHDTPNGNVVWRGREDSE